MFILESSTIAILFCVVTMLCWGSWANTQKLASQKWGFQLFYWDYSIGILVLTLIFAFTLGSSSETRGFIDDISQGSGSAIGYALLGGIVFNLANILLVIAIDIAGMAVAFPVGIGIALVLGTIVNYAKNQAADPVMLFAGVAAIALAIILNAMAYKKLPSDGNKTTTKGITISIAAGILMSFFYRFVADSIGFVRASASKVLEQTDVAGQISIIENGGEPALVQADILTQSEGTIQAILEVSKLSPYSALVIFAIGILLSNFVFNTYVMYKPISGEAVTYKDYFKQGTPKLHLIGLLGGIIWSIGMSLNIVAAGVASEAVAYGLGQGATLVGALWGVFIWKEFKDGKKGTNPLLAIMFIAYIIGLALIFYSK